MSFSGLMKIYPKNKYEKASESLHLYVKDIKILIPSEYKALRSEIPKERHKTILDILLITGLRYEELRRLYDNPGSVAKTLLMGFTEINRNLGVYVMPVDSFKWKHYAGEMILLNVRWYLKYALSYRNLEEMMAERGVKVDHTTIMRWVHQYSPEIEKKVRRYLRPTNDSWRMDETYIKVKVEYKYLYRAVDSNGNTIDFHVKCKTK